MAPSLTPPANLYREADGCTCCRFILPAYLSCWPGGTAICEVCGWTKHYADLDDAPERCPECGGVEQDEEGTV